MIIDMVSNILANGLNGLPDPTKEREKRDRALALEFVRLKEVRGAVQRIALDSGVNDRTVYRAIARQLEWARAAFEVTDAPASEAAPQT